MRILFVSGTSTGGSARSTEELAARLQARGHDVAALMGWRSGPLPYQVDIGDVKGAPRRLAADAGRAERLVRRQLSRRPRPVVGAPFPTWRARFPDRCLPAVHEKHRPDVVVVTSLDPRSWRAVHAFLADSGTQSIVYLRAAGTVGELAAGPLPDLVMANAQSLADLARDQGLRPVLVPSVVELERCRVDSTRERVLFVNPIAMRGLPVVVALAYACPDIPFVIHETAELHHRDRKRLLGQIRAYANVEVRPPVAEPRALYRDARILLAPYTVPNRPRVVLEAQSNAIPVLGADVAGLRESVPPGGVLVPPAAPIEEWRGALQRLWDDTAWYDEIAAAAERHSRRGEVQPPQIVDRFEAALATLTGARAHSRSARS